MSEGIDLVSVSILKRTGDLSTSHSFVAGSTVYASLKLSFVGC